MRWPFRAVRGSTSAPRSGVGFGMKGRMVYRDDFSGPVGASRLQPEGTE